MKICLIMPNTFPVPATKGGACETLANNLIDENEKRKKMEIVCVSVFEELAYQKSLKYNETKFIYINEANAAKDLSFKKQDLSFHNYLDKVYEEIKNQYFDYIIIEGGNMREYQYLLNKFPKEKCIAHLHGNYEGDEILDNSYGYFMTVSDYIADKLKSNNIIKSDRVKRVYNGIKIENFDKTISNEEKLKLKEKYGIKNNEKLIIFCGRTVKRKGIKELILAFKQIKNINTTKLMIVGNSNFENEVETEYDKELKEISKDIKDKIIFSGYIRNDELYKIYNISDLAVFPTLSEEAFGLVIVEAMASGCPIIATKSGGFPEIVNGTSSILVNKDERIVKELTQSIDYVIENEDVREKMSKEGRKRAKEFSNEIYYENYLKMLIDILKS